MIRAIVYTVVFILIQLLTSLTVTQALLLAGVDIDQQSATLLIVTQTAASVATIALFLYLRWTEVSRRYLLMRPWDVFFWCCIAALGTLIPSTFLQEQMPELPNFVEEQLDMILRDRWGYFAIGLLAPICEEIVFRGAVLRVLLRWTSRHWLAIAVSALLFALVHANPAQMPHAFLVGLLLGWLYYRTDSILPGIVIHWVNNSAAYVVYNLYPDPAIKLIDILGSQRQVVAAVIFSLFILLPALYQLHLRLKKAVGDE